MPRWEDIVLIDRPINEVWAFLTDWFNTGKRLRDYPHVTGSNVTLRRAQRAGAAAPEAMELFPSSKAAEEDDVG